MDNFRIGIQSQIIFVLSDFVSVKNCVITAVIDNLISVIQIPNNNGEMSWQSIKLCVQHHEQVFERLIARLRVHDKLINVNARM